MNVYYQQTWKVKFVYVIFRVLLTVHIKIRDSKYRLPLPRPTFISLSRRFKPLFAKSYPRRLVMASVKLKKKTQIVSKLRPGNNRSSSYKIMYQVVLRIVKPKKKRNGPMYLLRFYQGKHPETTDELRILRAHRPPENTWEKRSRDPK